MRREPVAARRDFEFPRTIARAADRAGKACFRLTMSVFRFLRTGECAEYFAAFVQRALGASALVSACAWRFCREAHRRGGPDDSDAQRAVRVVQPRVKGNVCLNRVERRRG